MSALKSLSMSASVFSLNKLRFDRIDERDEAFKQDLAEFKDLVDRRFGRLESAFDTCKDVQEL